MIKAKLKNASAELWVFGQCWALPKAGRPFEMVASLADGPSLITTSKVVSVTRNEEGAFSFITANSSYLLVILADSQEPSYKERQQVAADVSA
jgi:hypothetical protein